LTIQSSLLGEDGPPSILNIRIKLEYSNSEYIRLIPEKLFVELNSKIKLEAPSQVTYANQNLIFSGWKINQSKTDPNNVVTLSVDHDITAAAYYISKGS
jgi:hypothetical protein